MSYLLEALRKIEREKERRNPLSFGAVVPESEPRGPRHKGWMLSLLALNLALLGAGLVWFFSQETREVAAVPPTVATASESNGQPAPGPAMIREETIDLPMALAPPSKHASATTQPLDAAIEPATETNVPEGQETAEPVVPAEAITIAKAELAEAPPAQMPPRSNDISEAIKEIAPATIAESVPEPAQPETATGLEKQPEVEAAVAEKAQEQTQVLEPLSSSHPGERPVHEFKAVMDGVKTGCHVELTVGGELLQVVLAGVRCPPGNGDQAKKARMFTTRAAFARQVEVKQWGEDSERRLLCDLHTESGLFLNAALVEAGLAWASGPGLAAAEDEARIQGRGIWHLSLD